MKQKISITISSKTLEEIDSIIDNIYIRNRSQAIEFLAKNSLGENKTAIILSGGDPKGLMIGSEFRPTAKIKNSTVIELAIKKLRENNFRNIFFIAREELLTRVFGILKDGSHYGVKINYIEEKESEGTADSLKMLRGKISPTFLVVYGDIVFNRINLEELWNSHLKQKPIATLMLTTSSTPSRKGIVKIEGNRILKFIQKPEKSESYLGFSSIFVAEQEIIEYRGKSLEYDIFPALAEKGLLNGHLSSEKEIHVHTESDLKKI